MADISITSSFGFISIFTNGSIDRWVSSSMPCDYGVYAIESAIYTKASGLTGKCRALCQPLAGGAPSQRFVAYGPLSDNIRIVSTAFKFSANSVNQNIHRRYWFGRKETFK